MPGCEWTYDVDAGRSSRGSARGQRLWRRGGAGEREIRPRYTLTVQVLGACWPLADGRSRAAHPFFRRSRPVPRRGESAVSSHAPSRCRSAGRGGRTPAGFFYFELLFYFGGALLILAGSYRNMKSWRRGGAAHVCRRPRDAIWDLVGPHSFRVSLLACGVVGIGLLCLLAAQLRPRTACARFSTQGTTAGNLN